MIQVAIFGGYDGPLPTNKHFILTIFGAAEFQRPTVARQIIARKEAARSEPQPTVKPFFLTIFGGVDIKAPTLSAEYVDLRELFASGAMSLAEWEGAMVDLAHHQNDFSSFTLFGGFSECELPSETSEVDTLALHRHLGNISDATGRILQLGFGQPDIDRRAILRKALIAEQAAASPVPATA